METNRASPLITTCAAFVLLACGALICVLSSGAQSGKNVSHRIFGQKLVDDTLAAHPEIGGLELSATPPNKTDCVTIASNDPKEIGEKCDKQDVKVMKTNSPFVEKEIEKGKKIFAVTLPIHDRSGHIIGTAGIDFLWGSESQEPNMTERAKRIGAELEAQLTSKAKMFESVN